MNPRILYACVCVAMNIKDTKPECPLKGKGNKRFAVGESKRYGIAHKLGGHHAATLIQHTTGKGYDGHSIISPELARAVYLVTADPIAREAAIAEAERRYNDQ